MTNWAWEGLHDYLLNDGLSDQSKIDLKSRHTNLTRQPNLSEKSTQVFYKWWQNSASAIL